MKPSFESHFESPKQLTHIDLRNVRLVTLLLVTAKMLERGTAAGRTPALAGAVCQFLEDAASIYGDGSCLRIEAVELAKELGIHVEERSLSAVGRA